MIYHFPIEPFIRSLFLRPELVPSLWFDCGQYPEGHSVRSRGFKAKVLDNPVMNQDHRNIALVGYSDGVPFFDDMRRGGWPFMFKVANLPDGLSTKMANVHLGMMSANEYWELDEEAGILRRRIRAPKSLKPHLAVVVDDLLKAYTKGVKVRDSSVGRDLPGYQFRYFLSFTYEHTIQAAYFLLTICIQSAYKLHTECV